MCGQEKFPDWTDLKQASADCDKNPGILRPNTFVKAARLDAADVANGDDLCQEEEGDTYYYY